MYKDRYVLSVGTNGNIIEEQDDRVYLPFGQEYFVRINNKTNDRSACDLIINGDKIARFIINANSKIDIERYLDSNLSSGSKFRFTHLNDSAVKSKTSIDNGFIEAMFYKEKYKKPEPIIIKEDHHHWHYPKPTSPWNPWEGPRYGMAADNSMPQLRGMSCNTMAFASCDVGGAVASAATGAEGATVRGSYSDQKFSEVSGLEFESIPTIIKLKIVNGELQSGAKYCTGCGRKKSSTDRYCANCGIKY